LLNFSDEIYSNIYNNYNNYLFLIYKSCFDLLSFFGLYFRMVINNLFTLWWCQRSGGGLSPQTLNEAPNIIQEEVGLSDDHFINDGVRSSSEPSLWSADLFSSILGDKTLHTIFLAENIEDINSSTNFNNTERPTTLNQNQLSMSSQPTEHSVSSENSELASSSSSAAMLREKEKNVAVETAEPKKVDQTKSTKTVTFNPKSKIFDFEHSLVEYNPYFDISDSREIDTKTEDGLGALNKNYATKWVASNFEDQPEATDEISSTTSVQKSNTSEASLLLRRSTIDSSSSQTLEIQSKAELSTSQDTVNKNLTDLDIFGAINALKDKGFLSSNFNLSSFTSSDSNIAPDTPSLSETEPLTTNTSDSPADSSLDFATETNEANKGTGKKRSLPSDLEDSDLAPKRKKKD
jgi:hypothetical protein